MIINYLDPSKAVFKSFLQPSLSEYMWIKKLPGFVNVTRLRALECTFIIDVRN